MTAKNLTQYKARLTDQAFSEYYKVENELQEFASKLAHELVVSPNVEPFYELGFNVSAGQQFKIGLRITSHQFQDVLVRAYVPEAGYPVILNFAGVEVSVSSESELLKYLYEEIPANDDVLLRLRGILAVADNKP